jgi:hypothetical protein
MIADGRTLASARAIASLASRDVRPSRRRKRRQLVGDTPTVVRSTIEGSAAEATSLWRVVEIRTDGGTLDDPRRTAPREQRVQRGEVAHGEEKVPTRQRRCA